MQQHRVSPLLAQVLHGRQINLNVLNISLSLTQNPGLHEAARRLIAAIQQGKRIRIHGDYDADGVTASAILIRGLQALGAEVHGFIPHRLNEGYGIHPSKVAEHAEAADLLVTVDCGVSNVQEVAAMLQLGLEVIITDHHSPGDNFPDCLVVHPLLTSNYNPEIHNLTGAGVAYHLLWAIHQQLGLTEPRELLPLATIGTVADVAPLTGENRALVKAGLAEMATTQLAGVCAIIPENLTGKEPSARDVAFMLAPRINAAGRMGQVELALELLTSDDQTRAEQLAQQLAELNNKRRTIQDKMYEQALQIVDPSQPAIVVTHPEWHAGIMGIVASKLLETYYKPVFIMAAGKGSVRSTPNISAVQALRECHDLLKRYGGHMGAAGFAFEPNNFEALSERLNDYVARHPRPTPKIVLDAALPLPGVGLELLEQLASFEPCGEGNPAPCWHVRQALHSTRLVGKNKDSLQFRVENVKGIKFREKNAERNYPHDLAVSVMRNEWQGRVNAELMGQEGGLTAAQPLSLLGELHKGPLLARLDPPASMQQLANPQVCAYASADIAEFLRKKYPQSRIFTPDSSMRELMQPWEQLILYSLPPATLLREWLDTTTDRQIAFAFGTNTLQALQDQLEPKHLQTPNDPSQIASAALAYHRWQWAHAYQTLNDESWTRAAHHLAGVAI